MCIILSVLCCACAKTSPQASVPPEQISQASEKSKINDNKDGSSMNMENNSDYKLVIDNAESFLNAPMSTYKHPALSAYENEKIVEVNSKDDLKIVTDEYLSVVKENIDPQTHLVKPLKLPVHLIFNVTSLNELNDVLKWFKEKRDIVSTLEIRFAKDVVGDTMDMRIDLRTRPEDHNRVILTSLDDDPVDIRPLHIIVSGDVVQISNMVCNNCYALSTKVEASVGRLFEAKKISINGTKHVKKNQKFLIQTQMLVSSYTSNDEHPDIVFENCYFSDHELDKILSVDEGFDHGYLRNVGFNQNTRMKFGFPVQKKLSMDHVVASDGSVEIRLAGAKPEIEQKDCVLPEGAIRP